MCVPVLPSGLLWSGFISVGLLTDTLALLQEELRELREQPIDPQAEQEIIDSIEEVYFSNDAFDMVQHELEVRHSPCKYLIDRATPLNPQNDDSLRSSHAHSKSGSQRPPRRVFRFVIAEMMHF